MESFITSLPPALINTIVITLGSVIAAAMGFVGAKLSSLSAARAARDVAAATAAATVAVAQTTADATLAVAQTAASTTLAVAVAATPDGRDSLLALVTEQVERQAQTLQRMQLQIDTLASTQIHLELRIGVGLEHIFVLRGDLIAAGIAPESLRPIPEILIAPRA